MAISSCYLLLTLNLDDFRVSKETLLLNQGDIYDYFIDNNARDYYSQ